MRAEGIASNKFVQYVYDSLEQVRLTVQETLTKQSHKHRPKGAAGFVQFGDSGRIHRSHDKLDELCLPGPETRSECLDIAPFDRLDGGEEHLPLRFVRYTFNRFKDGDFSRDRWDRRNMGEEEAQDAASVPKKARYRSASRAMRSEVAYSTCFFFFEEPR